MQRRLGGGLVPHNHSRAEPTGSLVPCAAPVLTLPERSTLDLKRGQVWIKVMGNRPLIFNRPPIYSGRVFQIADSQCQPKSCKLAYKKGWHLVSAPVEVT